jgi:hypothetical protein
VGAKVRRVSKVGIESRRAHAVLHPGKPRSFPAHYGDEAIAQGIAPLGQSSSICLALSLRLLLLHTASTHSGRGVGFPHPGASPFAPALTSPRLLVREPRSRAHHAGDTWEQSAGESLRADRTSMASRRGGLAVHAMRCGRARWVSHMDDGDQDDGLAPCGC